MANKKQTLNLFSPSPGNPWSPLLLAAAGAGILGALLLIVTGTIWIVNKEFFLWMKILLGVGFVLVLFSGVIYRRPLWAGLSSRGAQQGYLTGFTILLVLAIVVCLNYVLYLFHWRKDLTKSQLYALAPQTVKVIQGLEKKGKQVEIRSYIFPGDPSVDPAQMRNMTELLEEYTKRSKNISFEVIDLLMPTDKAKEDEVSSPCVVFRCGDLKEKVYGYDANENKFTSALIKVTREKKRKVYFLTNHGEHPLEPSSPSTPPQPGMPPPRRNDLECLSFFKQVLEQVNHEVTELNLQQEDMPSPEDCAALVIAGPTDLLLEDEIDQIDGYLKQGGGVLVLVDPPSQGGVDVNQLISRWGLETPNELVRDRAKNIRGDDKILVLDNYTSHSSEITKDLPQTFLLQARPVIRSSTPNPDVTITDLAKTSTNSDAIADQPKGLLQAPSSTSQGEEGSTETPGEVKRNGPVTVIAIATTEKPPPPPPQPGMPPPPSPQEDPTKPKTRLVVIGDSDLATNRAIASRNFFGGMQLNANGYLLLNCVNWLAQEPELVSIPAKEPENETITLEQSQATLMIIITLPVTLLLIIITGFVVWWLRR